MKLFFLVSIFLISACSSGPDAIKYKAELHPVRNNSIYVVNHGWHTGLVVEADKVLLVLPELKKRFSKGRYFEFGWGDKGFYQAKEITVGLTIRAILWPTASVMHVVSFSENPSDYFSSSELRTLSISGKEMSSLLQFIRNSFSKVESGELIRLTRGIYGDSEFYQGVGDYYFMNTCNNWTAKGLKSFGMNLFPLFKTTAGSVISSIDENFEYLSKRSEE